MLQKQHWLGEHLRSFSNCELRSFSNWEKNMLKWASNPRSSFSLPIRPLKTISSCIPCSGIIRM